MDDIYSVAQFDMGLGFLFVCFFFNQTEGF